MAQGSMVEHYYSDHVQVIHANDSLRVKNVHKLVRRRKTAGIYGSVMVEGAIEHSQGNLLGGCMQRTILGKYCTIHVVHKNYPCADSYCTKCGL